MYNIFVRANAVFFYWTTVIFFLSMGCSVSSYYFEANPRVSLALNQHEELSYIPSHRAEQALFSLDMDADLRSVFNWNVKQLFVWISAEYVTRTYEQNQVVLWDLIVQSRDEALIQLKDEKLKYELISFERELKGLSLNLTVNWEVMPVVGVLKKTGRAKSIQVNLPGKYFKDPSANYY